MNMTYDGSRFFGWLRWVNYSRRWAKSWYDPITRTDNERRFTMACDSKRRRTKISGASGNYASVMESIRMREVPHKISVFHDNLFSTVDKMRGRGRGRGNLMKSAMFSCWRTTSFWAMANKYWTLRRAASSIFLQLCCDKYGSWNKLEAPRSL